MRQRRRQLVAKAKPFCALLEIAVALAASPFPGAAHEKDYSLTTRDLGCTELSVGRSRQICEAISASLTWQWMGHAIIAPGYKPSFEGIRKVYCALKIGKPDVGVLKDLKRYDPKRKSVPDWRLESSADILLRILANQDSTGDEPENSILNPKSPDYLLKKSECF